MNPNTEDFGFRIHRIFNHDFENYFKKSEKHKIDDNMIHEIINGLNQIFPLITENPKSFIDLSNNIINHAERIIKNKKTKDTAIYSELCLKLSYYNRNQSHNYKNFTSIQNKHWK